MRSFLSIYIIRYRGYHILAFLHNFDIENCYSVIKGIVRVKFVIRSAKVGRKTDGEVEDGRNST